MNITYKQSQFELFPGSPGSSQETGRPRYAFANITLSLENIIISGIVIVLFMIMCFSVGVERGKRIVRQTTNAGETENKELVGTVGQLNVQTEQGSPVPVSTANDQNIAKQKIPAEPDLRKIIQNPAQQVILPKNIYTIQVASYKKETHAQKEAMTLKQKGYEIFVVPKGEYSIVCVGKFSEKNDAKVFSNKLKSKYKDFIIRRL